MSGRAFQPDADTVARQRRASDPSASAWVAANAGSGKTWVLSRRVIRLLLAGTPPTRILCLTFTKAAAATMSNRIFAELGKWAVADDDALARSIAGIQGAAANARDLKRARRLFAEAIETPGGLKIQTIHGFCERILQQFPIEADLGGGFEILDEAAERELVGRARDGVLIRAAAEPDGRLGRALAAVLEATGDQGFLKALDALVRRRDEVRAALREDGDIVATALGIPAGETVADVEARIFQSPHFTQDLTQRFIEVALTGGKNAIEQAERFRQARDHPSRPARLNAWFEAFFSQDGDRRKFSSFLHKQGAAVIPGLDAAFDAECARLEDLRDRLAAHRARQATAALMTIGDAAIGDYERAKRARGALDFGDLIRRTADLLARSDAAAWVQYKLDQGIDHILVDEAQDTSPRQWQIVRQLAEEFFAGETARPRGRTLFAVGDEKQSIYSFQGAAPQEFSANARHFRAKASAAGADFAAVNLVLSFRSTADVLGAVDRVFAAPAMRAGVVSDDGWQDHVAIRRAEPGLVELWDPVLPVKASEPEDWTAPIDRLHARSPAIRVAERIADEIAMLFAPDFHLAGTGGRVRPRDVLILVRKRDAFVDAMNRVLKERGIPAAGADRLTLTDHIAVEDLIALGKTMLLPEDDLSLAALLKSPLIGLNDDHLFAIAHARGSRTLYSALAEKAPIDPALDAAHGQLAAWRARVDLLPPFEFYSAILSADGGRRRFIARLGPEADDVLDEFLARALGHEATGTPGLAGFLAALERSPPEIKREMDESRDEVRVMTVHGAKGLEAPVVFLVDNGAKPVSTNHDPAILAIALPDRLEDAPSALVWNASKHHRCNHMETAIAVLRIAAEQEYRRLLYVAMTRAADRLYVAAHGRATGLDDGSWYRLIETALAPEAEQVTDAEGARLARRWRMAGAGHDAVPPVLNAGTAPAASALTPDWLGKAVAESEAIEPLRPSKALAEMGEKDVREPFPAISLLDAAIAPELREARRGRAIHKLLEVLPDLEPSARASAGLGHVRRAMPDLSETEAEAVVGEALAVLDHPAFAAAFAPGSRAEVALVGTVTLADGARRSVSGQIDRLALNGKEVLVVDYKTNRRPPVAVEDTPTDYVAQMAIYRRLLQDLLPTSRVRVAILWTAEPRLVELPDSLLDPVLARFT